MKTKIIYIRHISTILSLMPHLSLVVFLISYNLLQQKTNFQFWGIFHITLLPFSIIALILQIIAKNKSLQESVLTTKFDNFKIIFTILNALFGIFGWLLFLVAF
jgi:hypothetical protein